MLVQLVGERLDGNERWRPVYIDPAHVAAVETVRPADPPAEHGCCVVHLASGASVTVQDSIWETVRRLSGPIETWQDSAGEVEL